MRIEAPAKLNLGLRIRGRRPDGYHLLESLIVPLDLADAVEIECTRGSGVEFRLEGDAPGVPAGEANLAWRAARAFLEESGARTGLRVTLGKRIPAAAGLGGGSSDAGAVLRGLDRLLPGALSARACRRLALTLGADVPFFLDPRPAWVSGIGDVVEPAEGIPALSVLLVHPGQPLATAAVYAVHDEIAASLTPGGAGPTLRSLSALPGDTASERTRVRNLLRALATCSGGKEHLVNDLESAAARLCPEVTTLRRQVEQVGAAAVGLSGSGPSVFGVFASRAAARQARERLALSPPARSWVARTAASS